MISTADELRKFIENSPESNPLTMPLNELQFLYGYYGWTYDDFRQEVRRRNGCCPHTDHGWCLKCMKKIQAKKGN